MAKSASAVKSKMARRMKGASEDVKNGYKEGVDPMQVIAQDTQGYGMAMAQGVSKAVDNGTYARGIEKAAREGSWRKAGDKAASAYVAAADTAADNYMKDYSDRMRIIDEVNAADPKKPGETRQEKIARAARVQEEVGRRMDQLYGRA